MEVTHTVCLKSKYLISNIDDVTSQLYEDLGVYRLMVNKVIRSTELTIDQRTTGIVAVLYERPLCAYKTVQIAVYLRNDAIAVVSAALHAYGYLHEMLYR